MGMKLMFIAMTFLIGLFGLVISLLLVNDKISPNNSVGVRTSETLANKDVWYKANRYFGKDFLIVSIIWLVVSVALYIYREKLEIPIILVITQLITVIGVLIPVVRIFSYLKKL